MNQCLSLKPPSVWCLVGQPQDTSRSHAFAKGGARWHRARGPLPELWAAPSHGASTHPRFLPFLRRSLERLPGLLQGAQLSGDGGGGGGLCFPFQPPILTQQRGGDFRIFTQQTSMDWWLLSSPHAGVPGEKAR